MIRHFFVPLLVAGSLAGTVYLFDSRTIHSKADELAHSQTQVQAQAKQTAATQSIVNSLERAWQAASSNREGAIDIAVYDSKTGQTAHYTNTGNTFNTASIVKLSILEALLLQDQQQGTSLTSDQLSLATPMIANSDNDAATTLWNLDGGSSGLARFFQTIGTSQTTMDPTGHWGLTQTTALDQLKVMNQIAYPGGILSVSSAEQANDLLNQVEPDQRWGVAGGVPSGVSVQLKDGWLQGSDADSADTWDINSVGHVHGNGVDYTIAVLTANNPTEQYGIDTIQALSTVTWSLLSTP